MIHPLLHLIATKPHLLADHVEAYAGLLSNEVGKATAALKLRLLLNAAGAVLMALGMVFGGVALMLWAVAKPADIHAPWVLWTVPLLPIIAGVLCFASTGSRPQGSVLGNIKQQVSADLRMLHEMSEA